MGRIWCELNNRRSDEKTISYAESHDQALVGDQTLIFRLIGPAMYEFMKLNDRHLAVDRGIALHKMIRLITLATAGNGYLNFMGNEFGHPEWIDFPREGNGWSYRYARRQWHLRDDPDLKYRFLAAFDRDMLHLASTWRLLASPPPEMLYKHENDKVLAFQRAGLVFVFNFHPDRSFADYSVQALPGKYRMIFDTDALLYGGHARLVPDQVHFTSHPADRGYSTSPQLSLYLPARTALVLQTAEKDSGC
jgi:1,4-alpha-glucan branching enzyme